MTHGWVVDCLRASWPGGAGVTLTARGWEDRERAGDPGYHLSRFDLLAVIKSLARTWCPGDHCPMAHPNELVVRRAYEALDRGDMAGFAATFAPDAILHGGEGVEVAGAERIAQMIWQLREMTNGTLRWDLHDVLANDDHAVALHTTRAERNGRSLADRVVYVFHVRDGYIHEAWFSGDPRVQTDFYGA